MLAMVVDGWEIVPGQPISGRPTYRARAVGMRAAVVDVPTGWAKVDRRANALRERLQAAGTEEQFQGVGLLCREVLISAALEVFDPARHPTRDGVAPIASDGKRMLEAIFGAALAGSAEAEARAHARAAVALALALQHRRTADFRMAALSAEATLSVVNLLAILGGRLRPLA